MGCRMGGHHEPCHITRRSEGFLCSVIDPRLRYRCTRVSGDLVVPHCLFEGFEMKGREEK